MKRREITPEVRAEIERLFRAGDTNQQIGPRLGLMPATVARITKDLRAELAEPTREKAVTTHAIIDGKPLHTQPTFRGRAPAIFSDTPSCWICQRKLATLKQRRAFREVLV